MKKLYVVKTSREFNEIIANKKYLKNNDLVIYYKPNNKKYDRYGITVGTKLGNAVFRNKYKRKLKAIIDNNKKDYVFKRDYIIMLRKGAIDKSYQDLEKSYLQLINKLEEK